MPRATWPLNQGRPTIEILLSAPQGTQITRVVLADTGGGSVNSAFDLLLDKTDCLMCGGTFIHFVQLHRAFAGSYPVYGIRVQIPQLGFDENLNVVGVPATPPHTNGIACFRFLNRFGYGNFGDPALFGLEI
jgi:hypothetical protein